MAEQDLSLTFSVDSTAAVDGVAQVNTALEQTATDAQAAGTAAAALGTNLAEGTAAAAPALSAVDQAAQNLKNTLDNLATAMNNPSSGPRTLFKDAMTAQLALTALQQTAADKAAQNLKNTLDNLATAMNNPSSGPRTLFKDAMTAQLALTALQQTAADSGVTLASLGVNVDAVKKALLDAATKASTATLELGKLRAAGLEAANQLQALQGKASSLSAMFLEMSKTGNTLEQAVGRTAVGVGIGILAFDAAVAAGERLGAALVKMIDFFSELSDKSIAAANAGDKMNTVVNELAAGHIKLGANVSETVRQYDLYSVASGKAGILTQQFNEFLKNIKPPQSLAEATKDVETFAATLEAAMAKGPEEAAIFLAAHKDVMDKMVQFYTTIGQRVPQELQNVITAQKQAAAAAKLLSDEGAQDAILSFSKITQARQAADADAARSAVAAQGRFEAQMKNLNQEELTSEQYSEKKKEIGAAS